KNGDRLPEPLFTPAYKAPMGEHDENITFEKAVELVGAERAAQLRDVSLDVYRRAAAIAEEKGLILADTKFEFGTDADCVQRLVPLLGCRGLAHRCHARGADGELRQADRARLAGRELGQAGRAAGAARGDRRADRGSLPRADHAPRRLNRRPDGARAASGPAEPAIVLSRPPGRAGGIRPHPAASDARR